MKSGENLLVKNLNKTNQFLGLIFVILGLLSILNNSVIRTMNLAGYIALILLFTLSGILFLRLIIGQGEVYRNEFVVYISFLIFLSTYLVALVDHWSVKGVYLTIELLMIFILFIVLSRYNLSNFLVSYFSKLGLICIIFLFVIHLYDKQLIYNQLNSNTVGALVLFLFFFIFTKRKLNIEKNNKIIDFIILFMIITLLFINQTRSAWLSLFFFFVIYYVWPLIIKSRFLYLACFGAVILMILGITFVYPNLPQYQIANTLNELFYEYTGKFLFSGREHFWENIILSVKEHPYFGYSFDASFSNSLYDSLSAHNMYLEILLQTGFIGLSTFFILCFSIWCNYRSNKNPYARFSAACFLAILVHQLFEVTLLQNNLAIGVIQWMLISLGCNINFYRS